MLKKCCKSILLIISGMFLSIFITVKKMKKLLDMFGAENKKNRALCNMLSEWLTVKVEKKSICDYLRSNGCNVIAIYGMNYIGEILLKDLKDGDIEVKYAVDKNADCIKTEIDVLKPDDKLPAVDAVVVTAIASFDEIKANLNKKVQCPILSLKEIINELL